MILLDVSRTIGPNVDERNMLFIYVYSGSPISPILPRKARLNTSEMHWPAGLNIFQHFFAN